MQRWGEALIDNTKYRSYRLLGRIKIKWEIKMEKPKINNNIIEGKWLELKGEVQKAWGNLTNDELDKTKGDFKAISGLIQQRYGEAEVGFGKRLEGIFKKFQEKKDDIVKEVKNVVSK